jgi:hypothetical protein
MKLLTPHVFKPVGSLLGLKIIAAFGAFDPCFFVRSRTSRGKNHYGSQCQKDPQALFHRKPPVERQYRNNQHFDFKRERVDPLLYNSFAERVKTAIEKAIESLLTSRKQ